MNKGHSLKLISVKVKRKLWEQIRIPQFRFKAEDLSLNISIVRTYKMQISVHCDEH